MFILPFKFSFIYLSLLCNAYGHLSSKISQDYEIRYKGCTVLAKNYSHIVYQSLYLSISLSLQQNIMSHIYQPLLEPVSSNFLYTLRVAKFIV